MSETRPRYWIQEVRPSDDPAAFKAVVRMDKKCFPVDDRWLPDEGWWWVAFGWTESSIGIGCENVGYAGLIDEGSGVGYLCRAGVIKSARGHGLQRTLIDARVQRAKEAGLKTLITATLDNTHSMNNLIEAGFRCYDPLAPWLVEHAVYWRRNL